jgi:hypothetical protein
MKRILEKGSHQIACKVPTMASLNRGDQIAYLPGHVGENLDDPSVELGFVTSVKKFNDGQNMVFCRYWMQGKPGELRTKSASEATPLENVVLYMSVDQDVVTQALKEFCA